MREREKERERESQRKRERERGEKRKRGTKEPRTAFAGCANMGLQHETISLPILMPNEKRYKRGENEERNWVVCFQVDWVPSWKGSAM